MRRWIPCLLLAALLAASPSALALNPGSDVVVPGAARVATWVTDLYVFNPNDTTVGVTVYWLVRDQANPSPESEAFSMLSGETLVLEDVISTIFGLSEGTGAFRVVADAPVAVNCRIYSTDGSQTFGQGFEGVPVAAAIVSGSSTDVFGLAHNDAFRTNIVLADATGSGSTVALSLRDTAGNELAAGTYDLEAWEPMLFPVTWLDAALDFDNASLHAEVTSGAAIVVGSKVDNLSTDPTTLEAWIPLAAAGTVDGTYQFAVYDSLEYAAGGNIVVVDGEVQAINGTYMNWDKDDNGDQVPDCTLIFWWGGILPEPIPVEDFATGVSFSTDYSFSGSGVMDWTIQFEMDGTTGFVGTLDAVGSAFPASPEDQSGCNGTFPQLELRAGKSD